MAMYHIYQTVRQKQSLEFWMEYIFIQAENSIAFMHQTEFPGRKILKNLFWEDKKTHHQVSLKSFFHIKYCS